jgi:hypothetical protein
LVTLIVVLGLFLLPTGRPLFFTGRPTAVGIFFLGRPRGRFVAVTTAVFLGLPTARLAVVGFLGLPTARLAVVGFFKAQCFLAQAWYFLTAAAIFRLWAAV